MEFIWIISKYGDQLYVIKFQGKPLKIVPRIYSKIANSNEKIKTKLIFVEANLLIINVGIP